MASLVDNFDGYGIWPRLSTESVDKAVGKDLAGDATTVQHWHVSTLPYFWASIKLLYYMNIANVCTEG
ncbi:MAG: hypothetical protein ACK52W_02655 [Alphaproteobacteria bacterium]|jgi:hypothetical protein